MGRVAAWGSAVGLAAAYGTVSPRHIYPCLRTAAAALGMPGPRRAPPQAPCSPRARSHHRWQAMPCRPRSHTSTNAPPPPPPLLPACPADPVQHPRPPAPPVLLHRPQPGPAQGTWPALPAGLHVAIQRLAPAARPPLAAPPAAAAAAARHGGGHPPRLRHPGRWGGPALGWCSFSDRPSAICIWFAVHASKRCLLAS